MNKEVEIRILVMPLEAGTYKPQGITFASFGLQPIVRGLPASLSDGQKTSVLL